MKINTLIVASAIAAAPAPELEKRQAATSTYAGTCSLIVNPIDVLDVFSSSCSYASTAGPYTAITCLAVGVPPLIGVGLCNAASVASTCSTSTTTRVFTTVSPGFLFGILGTDRTVTSTTTSAIVGCSTATFAARPAGAVASTTAAAPGIPLPTVAIPSAALPTLAAPTLAIPTTLPINLPSLALSSVKLPSATLPSLAVPSVAIPSVALPSVAVPSVAVPSLAVPSLALPSIQLPSATLPSLAVPSIAVPTLALPSLSVPTLALPSASVPTLVLPSVALPSVALPSVALSSVALPSIALPSVSLPSLVLPSLALPSATLPLTLPSLAVPSVNVPSIALPSVSLPVTLPAVPSTSILPSGGLPRISRNGATYKGCFADSTTDRALAVRVADVGTVEQCVSACQAAGYSLAGLEYYHECYCGNAIAANHAQIADGSCNAPCDGDATQTCGNANALQVYNINQLPALSSIALPAVSGTGIGLPVASATAPVVKTIPLVVANGASAPATFAGCYQDNVNARSLPFRVSDVGSVDQCVANCAAQGFSLAGVEYTNECYCGNAIAASQVATGSCQKYTCNAAPSQFCGGDSAIQVYRLSGSALPSIAIPNSLAQPSATATSALVKTIPLVVANGASAPATFAGCYEDSVNARSLGTRVADVGSVDQCVAACAAQGFALAGVEYTNECYCGNTITAPQKALTSCQQYTCNAAPSQYCGGDNSLQVYRLSGSAPSAGLPSSLGQPAATATSAVIKTIPLVVANGASAPATFAGCYEDSVNARSLGTQVANVGSVDQCVAACAAQGFALAGVEYTNECFCGNAITAPQKALTSCQQYTCNAAPSQYCGGDNSLQVYRLSGSAPSAGVPASGAGPAATASPIVKAIPLLVSNGGATAASFAGCFQDSTSSRSLTTRVANVGSVEQCVAACSAQGFVFAGVEYTNECYCGNGITAPQIATTRCQQYTCNAAPSEYCGGDNALQVYRLSVSAPTAAPSGASQAAPAATGAAPVSAATIPLLTPSGATFRACYLDNIGARALRNRLADVTDSMPANTCATACRSAGYSLSGLEYGHECWCDNSINNGQTQTAASDCSQICDGNSSQYCGNADRVQVYSLN